MNNHRTSTLTAGLRGRLPLVTITVLTVTTIVTAAQFADPRVLDALWRDPTAFANGQWWRVVTALFVHSDGIGQFLLDALGIALIGTVVEWRFGGLRWLLLYFGGGVVGHAIGIVWQPFGAGSSVAVMGLIGGLCIDLLRGGEAPFPALMYMLYIVAGLVGEALGGLKVAVILCVALAVAFTFVMRSRNLALVARIVVAVDLIGAVVLIALRDIHGPPLLVGAAIALALSSFAPVPPDRRASSPHRAESER